MHEKTAVNAVEAFHLVFLRVLETKLDRSVYVVKGGVNLRAWFGSLRYSEDMDLDVVGGKRHVLREKVEKLLAAPAFQTLLRAQELSLVRSSQPKQTDTTQRWKFEIRMVNRAVPLHTKIEFSRRGSEEQYVLEPVRPEIVRPYGIPAPTANHYTAAAAMRQKIAALTDRTEPQARDIWDLDHLFRTTAADLRPLPPRLRAALPAALDRVMEMPFEAFRSQVVPYLAPDHHDVYGTSEAWDRMRELVADRLLELQS